MPVVHNVRSMMTPLRRSRRGRTAVSAVAAGSRVRLLERQVDEELAQEEQRSRPGDE